MKNKIKDLLKAKKAILLAHNYQPAEIQDVADMTGHLTPSSLEEELKKLEAHKTDIYLYHMKRHHQQSIQEEIASISNRSIRVLEDGRVVWRPEGTASELIALPESLLPD